MEPLYRYALTKTGKETVKKGHYATVHVMKNQRTYCGIRAPYSYKIGMEAGDMWCDNCKLHVPEAYG